MRLFANIASRRVMVECKSGQVEINSSVDRWNYPNDRKQERAGNVTLLGGFFGSYVKK